MQPTGSADPIELYLPLLVEGSATGLLALFAAEPVIDDPREGHVEGREAVRRFVEASAAWLRERQAREEHLRTTRAGGRAVAEAVLHLVQDGKPVPLPVAVVGDFDAEGRLRWVRVYHSNWPLTGSHRVRPPLLPEDPNATVAGVVARYQRALAEGDLEAMLKLFEPDGYAREPSGGDYVYRGPEALREFYGGLFSTGGFPLQHCAVIDDGVCCAIEYNAVKWGKTPLSPQAGVGVYERGPSGLLRAARIYDDVAVEEGAAAAEG
jgi:hypothetical protein